MKPVLIIGGGIAGLATAHALAQLGQAVEVWEQAAAFSEVGAGLQVTPNAFTALEALGLKAAAQAVCHWPPAVQMGDAETGKVIFRRAANERGAVPAAAASTTRTSDTIASEFNQPYGVAHRAALHGVLLAACQANPRIALQVKRTVSATDVAELAGEGPVIGADGLHSVVRGALHGVQAVVKSGYVAYRALLPLQPNDSPDVQMWAGAGRHLVRYPVIGLDGEAQLNMVAFFRSEQSPTGWDAPADPAPLHAAWAHSCAEVQALLARATAANAWRSWAVADREPDLHNPARPEAWSGRVSLASASAVAGVTAGASESPRLSRFPVLLVGDAAHPMLPFAAQGANLALEDAASLQRLWRERLASAADPLALAQTFAAFEAARYPRASQVQALARRNRVLYHASGPLAWARDAALKLAPPARRSMDWVYRWTP